jgi:chromate reductase
MKVLGLAGSLRQASHNRALLRAAQELAPPGMEIEIAELDRIPLYNGDVEATGDPEPVADFKQRIREADALLIVTPEYNHGVPGVLKNAIDWASRPPLGSPLTGKLVAIMGAGGRSGTAHAQRQLRDHLAFPKARVIGQPEVRLEMAWDHFDSDGRLVTDVSRRQVRALLDALAADAAPATNVAA